MALSKTDIMDLMVEEKQIALTIEQATVARDAAKKAAEQAHIAALTAADEGYVRETQAAESRLLDIHTQLKQDGGWKGQV